MELNKEKLEFFASNMTSCFSLNTSSDIGSGSLELKLGGSGAEDIRFFNNTAYIFFIIPDTSNPIGEHNIFTTSITAISFCLHNYIAHSTEVISASVIAFLVVGAVAILLIVLLVRHYHKKRGSYITHIKFPEVLKPSVLYILYLFNPSIIIIIEAFGVL